MDQNGERLAYGKADATHTFAAGCLILLTLRVRETRLTKPRSAIPTTSVVLLVLAGQTQTPNLTRLFRRPRAQFVGCVLDKEKCRTLRIQV